MNSPDSSANNPDPSQTEGVGNEGLDVTSNYSGRALDVTGAYDSKTRPQGADATSAYDSNGQPLSSSASIQDRMRAASSAALIGTVIGGYRIIAPLGQGGMGRVFRADDSSGRPVAIKLLSPDLARSSEALARFKQEGLIASQINHSRCVFVHRVDEEAGTPFIAMELMTGLTLKDLVIQKGPLPYADAVRLILQCIEGLIEAHSRGMIHRDIKPANCYLDTRGNVKIGDFGLARSLVGDSELTQTGAFIGTPLFASPEQLLGQNIDERSDIYSLTATLYFLLAGKAPFESPHAAQVIARIASSDPPPFSSVEIQVPEELERIVMKGLSRDSNKRYQTFAEMQADLLALLAPKPETATLARRIIAGLADGFLLSLVSGVLTLAFLPKWLMEDSRFFASLSGVLISAVYFFISEATFASSLGKAALRIRVADAATGRRASIKRIAFRVAAYSAVGSGIEFSSYGLLYVTGLLENDVIYGSALALSAPLAYMIYLSTWWYSGKRQLFHDWVSGTECLVSAPPVLQATQLDLPDYTPPVLKSGQPLPECLGRFRITSEIVVPNADESVRWLIGDDPQLERSVWIAVSNDPDIDYEQQQCVKDPSTRLRFIEQGLVGSERWFAYVAPEGMPLSECLSKGVHFAWPVTSFVYRQLLSHFHSIASAGNKALIASLGDWWVDRAGRLSIVSLGPRVQSKHDGASVEQIQGENASTYKELLQTVSMLALPRSHRFRKKLCKSTNGSLNRCLLAREVLPPLRSTVFCESVASGKFIPSTGTLESELNRLNKGANCVSSKNRFFNSVMSIAFCTPFLALVMTLMVMPVIKYFLETRENLQVLSTFEQIVNDDQPDPTWWKGASDEQKNYWTSEVGKTKLRDLTSRARTKLDRVYAKMGKIEKTILTSIPFESELMDPPHLGLVLKSREQSNSESNASSKAGTEEAGADSDATTNKTENARVRYSIGDLSITKGFVDSWNESHMKTALAIGSLDSVDYYGDPTAERRLGMIAFFTLVGLTLWTFLTFGGLSSRFTGICFVSRDGCRMGILRSAWRALVVFAPGLIIVLLLSNWPIITLNDLWWTTQLKRILIILPLGYLASTLIWNNRTIADVLSGTTAIPR